MTTSPNTSTVTATIDVLNQVLDSGRATHVGFRLWEGTLWPDARPRPTTLVLRHPGSLRAMVMPMTEMNLSEAYLRDDYDIEGSIEEVFTFLLSQGLTMGALQKARLAASVLRLPKSEARVVGRPPAQLSGKRHSPARDREAVAYHYNLPNDFYALWLDSTLTYSCAVFASETEALESAQQRKLDLICRKLRLKPGQRLLDIGCGWGGLVLHAAQHYGVEAVGVTLGEAQVALAQERIAHADLASRCRVLLRDYRELDERTVGAGFDAVASIGMCEHVGEANLPLYFGGIAKLLKPQGVLLNHGITRGPLEGAGRGPSFVDSYVFPDGELLPWATFISAGEAAGLEARDGESLREHYALTLRQWVRRLEARHGEAVRIVDEASYRAWRLYMASAAWGFSMGRVRIAQTLFVKPDAGGHSALPLSRADWYQDA